jgi:Flp pilus assembly pilin Flp
VDAFVLRHPRPLPVFMAVKSSDNSKTAMYRFLEEEQGQDMIEYTLLLAFIALSGAALFIGMGRNINSIWTVVNSRMASAGSGE